MNKPSAEEIKYKRRKVLNQILETIMNLNNDDFTEIDFMLDRIAREGSGLMPKELGKAPYDFIDL